MLALLLTTLLTLAPPNLLPGDTSFELGIGPIEVTESPGLAEKPRMVDGALVLPTPGASGLAGCEAIVPASEPLTPARVHTFAWRARGTTGAVLRATVIDAFGRTETGRFVVGEEWRTYQLTFALMPVPLTRDEAKAANVDWASRRLMPGDEQPPPRISAVLGTAPHAGLPGSIRIDDLRLVEGANAREAAVPALAVDATWDGRSWGPLWQARQPAVEVAARGPDSMKVQAAVRDSLGQVVRRLELPGGTKRCSMPLDDLAPGFYTLELEACTATASATTLRPLCLLRDRTMEALDTPWLLDAAGLAWGAGARALGYRQVRLVATWASLADREGALDAAALDRLITPALAAGLDIILALAVTGPGSLPAGVVTPRRMDSHGYLKGVALPDLGRFSAWVEAVARHCAGQSVVYELDQEPYRSWHANDYVEYLRRFAAAVRSGDPGARVAGLGFGFENGGAPRLAAFVDESAKRGAAGLVDLVTAHLPERLGDAPETMLGLGIGALLAAWPADRLPAAAQFAPRPVRPVGPLLSEQPRLVPAARLVDEVSPWQLGARVLRTYLLALRAAPAAFATGWQGGYGPREAYLDHWSARYAGARFIADRPLGAGLQAVLLELPSGLGLAAIWDASDSRWSPVDEREDGPAPLLRLAARPGILRARGPDGRELRETYGDDGLVLPLGFAPVFIEGPSPAWVDERLLTATVVGHEAVALAVGLGFADGQPGLLLTVANQGAGRVSGEASLTGSGAVDLLASRLGYRAEVGETIRRLVPLVRWAAGAPAPVRVVAEAGREIRVLRRVLLQWPAIAAPLPAVDASEADWPQALPSYQLASADRLTDPDADWLGPDDASATVRLRYHDGALALFADVRDDRLAAPADGFAGDGMELFLDLDLRDALAALPDGDDYRVVLAPLIDGQFQGRHKLIRGAGPGPALVMDKAVRSSFRKTTTGYCLELLLPLTPEGRAALEAGGFGADLMLNDDDGAGRAVRLALFGDAGNERSTDGYAHIWPARQPFVAPAELSMAHELPDPPLRRVGFEWGEAAPWRLTPTGEPGTEVRLRALADFPRGATGLVVTRAADGESAVSEVPLPAGATHLSIWARAAERAGDARPRLGVELAGQLRWFEPERRWRRLDLPMPPGASLLRLRAGGVGRVEIAELNFGGAEARR